MNEPKAADRARTGFGRRFGVPPAIVASAPYSSFDRPESQT